MSIIQDRLMTNKNKQLGKELNEARIRSLKDAGYSNKEIGRVMGLAESTIRLILESQKQESK